MRVRILLPFIIAILGLNTGFSQGFDYKNLTDKAKSDLLNGGSPLQDTIRKKTDIELSRNQAIQFLQRTCQTRLWKSSKNPFRSALGQLAFEASHPPMDSAEYFLRKFPYDSIKVPWEKFYIREPLRIRVPADSVVISGSDTIPKGDTSLIGVHRSVTDTTVMAIADTLDEIVSSNARFPFRYYRYPGLSDSIKAAVNVLLNYLEARDSSIIYISGSTGRKYPLWLNSKSDPMIRYWLKNDLNDSVTVWIGNPSKNTIGLYLEHGVNFKRPAKQGNVSKARIDIQEQDHTKLIDVGKIITRSAFWKYRTEASFALNQGMVSNWVKGGENNISTALDITWYADYSNKPMLLSSNHFARIKYGLIASGEEGIRKNIDLVETNSKFNHKAFGKFDFSAIMLFKTQISKGFNYPNDTIPVSKFMNPAILTLGIGLDYKPDKSTSINFSPLSYKGTFVPDTGRIAPHIDQTRYGIASDRRSKHEPGVSIMITNELRPIKTVTVTNRLQLFTNYIHNPLNIDVDWEMILQANLNWFTDVRLNTHLIFDDDTKTLVFDRHRNPVLGSDGLQKKTARIQFKELLGFSFVFRF